MIRDGLLGSGYRFSGSSVPPGISDQQIEARADYLAKIHRADSYIDVSSCPFCGHGDFTRISEIDARGLPSDIVICEGCGGCFKSRILGPEANRFYYENISRRLRGKSEPLEDLFWNRVNSQGYPRYYFVKHFLSLRPGRDMVAEFGCHDGANLYPWKENGFEVLGVDLDGKMVEFGKNKGLDLVKDDFLKFSFTGKRPKLIILSHVLEHVSNINAAVEKIAADIKPDGYIFIEVPGVRGQGLGRPLNYFDVEHNYYFDAVSLNRVMENHSLKAFYKDEYIRFLCTPMQNKDIEDEGPGGISTDRVRAAIAGSILKMVNVGNGRLFDIMKEGEENTLKIRILNKLKISEVYFKSRYFCLMKGAKKDVDRQ